MNLTEYFDTTNDTPEKLSARVGCHWSTIYRIKKGTRNPGSKLIPVIFKETGGLVTPNDLLLNLSENNRQQ